MDGKNKKVPVAEIIGEAMRPTAYSAVLETLVFDDPNSEATMCLLIRQVHNSLVLAPIGVYQSSEIRMLDGKVTLFVRNPLRKEEGFSFFKKTISDATGFELCKELVYSQMKVGQCEVLGEEGQVRAFGKKNQEVNVMVSCYGNNEMVLSIPPILGASTLSFYQQALALYPTILRQLEQTVTFDQIMPTVFLSGVEKPRVEVKCSASRWCLYDYQTEFDFLEKNIIPGYNLVRCPACGTYYLINQITGHIMPAVGSREGEKGWLRKDDSIIDLDEQAREKKQ